MDMTPTSSGGFGDAALPSGSTCIDPLGTLKITVNSISPTGAQVTVAQDTRTVPNIVRRTRAVAANALLAAGLVLGSEADEVIADCFINGGLILDQDPVAGTLAPRGSAVGFTIGVNHPGS